MRDLHRIRRIVLQLSFLSFALARPFAQEAKICRVSVENAPSHFQALAARRFAAAWTERAGGTLRVEFFDGARLFRDADALSALSRGQVEIIFPGIWQLDRYVPDFAALMLPSVYGRRVETMRALVDGPFGGSLSEKIEKTLDAVTLGKWLDAGHAHIFTLTTSIRSAKDIAGKRIRVAGGKGNEERIRAMGAEVLSISLPDLPSYLDNRLIDGVLSNYIAVESSQLYRYGIRAVFEDEEYYPFYVPLIARRFWASLTEAERRAALDAWAAVVSDAREEVVKAHADAKARLVSRGLAVYGNSPEDVSRQRATLVRSQEEMARRLNVSPDTVRELVGTLRGNE